MTSTIPTIGKKTLLPALNRAGREIYSFREICKLAGIAGNYAHNVVSLLEKEARLVRLERGTYLYVPEGFEGNWAGNTYLIASHLVQPYAISYWSALNHWHFTEQIPSTVFIQTTVRKFYSERVILGVKYKLVTLGKNKFYGLATVWDKSHKIQMTGKEKTIVDCLDHPEYCGGIIEVVKGLHSGFVSGADKLDMNKVINYALKIDNKTVVKRLGYLFEVLNISVPEKKLFKMKAAIGKGYSLLDTTLPDTGKLNSHWRLKENLPKDSLTEWRKH